MTTSRPRVAPSKVMEQLRQEQERAYNPSFPLTASWRLRESIVPEVELKYVQEDIQNFVDVLCGKGENGKGFRVVWHGQEGLPGFTRTDEQLITLSYAPVNGQAPCLAKDVDIVAGVGIHEVGHAKMAGHRPYVEPHLAHVANVLEDAWIDYGAVKDRPVLGAYIQRCRTYYQTGMQDMLEKRVAFPKTFSKDEIVSIWGSLLLYNVDVFSALASIPRQDTDAVVTALTGLLKIGMESIKKLPEHNVYRRLLRAADKVLREFDATMREQEQQQQEQQQAQQSVVGQSAAAGSSGEQTDAPRPEATPEPSRQGDPGDEQGDGDEQQASGGSQGGGDEQGEQTDEPTHDCLSVPSNGKGAGSVQVYDIDVCMGDNKAPMEQDLAERVWQMQEHKAEDVSDIAGARGFIMKLPGKEKVPVVTNRHVEQIRQAFESRRQMNTVQYPFQESGRVCKRTLARAYTGSKDVFEETIDEDEIDVALGILVDCSGSVGTHSYLGRTSQWDLIVQSCATMVEAFSEGELDLVIMAYRSGEIYRLYEPDFDGLHLKDVRPSGGTPSVPAMRVIRNRMLKLCSDRRDKIIFHLTDGEPNDGGGWDAMQLVVRETERKGFKVIGMGVGVPEGVMKEQYGKYFCATSFDEVPARIRQILEKL